MRITLDKNLDNTELWILQEIEKGLDDVMNKLGYTRTLSTKGSNAENAWFEYRQFAVCGEL